MPYGHATTPRWVARTLNAGALFVVARVLLTLPYWWSGLDKLFHFHTAVLESAGLHLPHPELVAGTTIAVQLIGSLLVIADRYLWLGAGALAVFTLIATLAAHAFWTLSGAARFAEMNVFLEHIALIAAFALVAIASHYRKGLARLEGTA